MKMEADEEEKSLLECSMNFLLLEDNGEQVAVGEGKGTIGKEYLTLLPKFGDILPFHLRIIKEIRAENYRITLPLFSKETIVLFNLGYCFEDFQRVLRDTRNEVMIKDLLMNEAVKKPDVNMEFAYYDENGNEKQKGSGKVRLYETGLVVLPQNSEFLRLPYSDVANVSEEAYSIKIGTELGGQLVFQKMGSEFSPFVKAFSDIIHELQNKAVSSIKALYPGIDPISLRKIAALMKEGKAAKRADIEAVNPRMWQEMEKKIADVEMGDSYNFLKEMGRQEKTAIGFKRGLLGNLTGEYVWFLIPIYGSSEKGYGNAIVMEAGENTKTAKTTEKPVDTEATVKPAGMEALTTLISGALKSRGETPAAAESAEATGEESTGKATYFFRIVGRNAYPTFKTPEQFDAETDKVIKTVNRCMLDINFRREPIYLPDEKLDEAEYFKYQIALQKIPSLKFLRGLFVGRVIHASPAQWKSDVMDLLKFNIVIRNDTDKWKKQET